MKTTRAHQNPVTQYKRGLETETETDKRASSLLLLPPSRAASDDAHDFMTHVSVDLVLVVVAVLLHANSLAGVEVFHLLLLVCLVEALKTRQNKRAYV